MGIYIKEDVVVVEEKEFDLTGAVRLKGIMEEFLEKGRETFAISLPKVEKLSGTALRVIIRASQSFKDFKLEDVNPAIADELIRLENNASATVKFKREYRIAERQKNSPYC